MGESAFPGKREEANRAGITPRILVRTIDFSTDDDRMTPLHWDAWIVFQLSRDLP